jgi:hypothetical protein
VKHFEVIAKLSQSLSHRHLVGATRPLPHRLATLSLPIPTAGQSKLRASLLPEADHRVSNIIQHLLASSSLLRLLNSSASAPSAASSMHAFAVSTPAVRPRPMSKRSARWVTAPSRNKRWSARACGSARPVRRLALREVQAGEARG